MSADSSSGDSTPRRPTSPRVGLGRVVGVGGGGGGGGGGVMDDS